MHLENVLADVDLRVAESARIEKANALSECEGDQRLLSIPEDPREPPFLGLDFRQSHSVRIDVLEKYR